MFAELNRSGCSRARTAGESDECIDVKGTVILLILCNVTYTLLIPAPVFSGHPVYLCPITFTSDYRLSRTSGTDARETISEEYAARDLL